MLVALGGKLWKHCPYREGKRDGVYFEPKLDEKGRVPLPRVFRDRFKAGIVLTRGFDGCLLAYPRDEWRRSEEAYAALPNDSAEIRRVVRFRRLYAWDCELDNQGRILIPAHLREQVGIRDGVVIVDAHPRYLEIWSAEAFEEEESRMREQVPQLAGELKLLQ